MKRTIILLTLFALGGCQTTESICSKYYHKEVYFYTPRVGHSLANEYAKMTYNHCVMVDATMRSSAPTLNIRIVP